jgi:6-phosphogluconolactonase
MLVRIGLVLAFLTKAFGADPLVLFGTNASGPGKGFSFSRFNLMSGVFSKPEFLLESVAPSYFAVTRDGQHVYAVNENASGSVSAYAFDSRTPKLTLLNQQPAGDGPCFISLDATEHFALIANYGGGSVAVFPIQPDGSLGARAAFVQQKGSSVNRERQQHAFAHSIRTDPSNRFAIAADLGADKLFVYRFDAKTGALQPNDPPAAALKPGSGPRHFVFHPNGGFVYVADELSSSVTVFAWNRDRGTLTEVETVSALPADWKGTNTSAEIGFDPMGRWLFASQRGHNSIAIFDLNPANGKIVLRTNVPTDGKIPRNFTFDPTGTWMLVANHGSDNVTAFRVNPQTGELYRAGSEAKLETPFCLRFVMPR